MLLFPLDSIFQVGYHREPVTLPQRRQLPCHSGFLRKTQVWYYLSSVLTPWQDPTHGLTEALWPLRIMLYLYWSLVCLTPESLVILLPSPTVATYPRPQATNKTFTVAPTVYPLAALRKPKDWEHGMGQTFPSLYCSLNSDLLAHTASNKG